MFSTTSHTSNPNSRMRTFFIALVDVSETFENTQSQQLTLPREFTAPFAFLFNGIFIYLFIYLCFLDSANNQTCEMCGAAMPASTWALMAPARPASSPVPTFECSNPPIVTPIEPPSHNPFRPPPSSPQISTITSIKSPDQCSLKRGAGSVDSQTLEPAAMSWRCTSCTFVNTLSETSFECPPSPVVSSPAAPSIIPQEPMSARFKRLSVKLFGEKSAETVVNPAEIVRRAIRDAVLNHATKQERISIDKLLAHDIGAIDRSASGNWALILPKHDMKEIV
jgi:hypothetical protein